MISVDGNLLIIDLCLKRRLEIRLVLSWESPVYRGHAFSVTVIVLDN